MLYACYETPEELDLQAQGPPHARPAAGLWPRGAEAHRRRDRRIPRRTAASRIGASCCRISPSDPLAAAAHRNPWTDLVRGEETVDLASLSDPVLVREDGTYLYTLPSVVDDIEMGISHVIRGDDHVTNTGVQIALFKALGAEPPAFGHHNLLTTASGEGLSKRSGALSIASLRESGIEPMAVASLAVLIGTSENVSAVPTMAELAERFDLGRDVEIGVEIRSGRAHRAQPRAAPPHAVLRGAGPAGRARHFRRTGRAVLARGARQSRQARRCRGLVADRSQRAGKRSRNFPTKTATSCARPSISCRQNPGTRRPGRPGRTQVKEATGRKGKALFMPLRLALTGLVFRAGACRSIAPSGSGRNTGPTTLTLRSSGGGSASATAFGDALDASTVEPASALAKVSGSAAGSGRATVSGSPVRLAWSAAACRR